MKLPILAYGNSILRKPCKDIDSRFSGLEDLINNMWDTMRNAEGCGLAAPQIGHDVRLFIVDSKSTYDNLEEADRKDYFDKNDTGILETFINAKIIQRSEDFWEDEEGCLSIPGLSQKVKRSWSITIEFLDKDFEKQVRTYSGITARMIQHEYDHIEGILFLDYLKPLTRKLLEAKLKRISKGQVRVKYPMRFI